MQYLTCFSGQTPLTSKRASKQGSAWCILPMASSKLSCAMLFPCIILCDVLPECLSTGAFLTCQCPLI